MILTPSLIGAVLAGVCLWCFIWAAVYKLDDLPWIKNWTSTSTVLQWIRKHKTQALIATEILNLLSHGIATPLSVAFNVGGTIVNILAIYAYLPLEEKVGTLYWKWHGQTIDLNPGSAT